MLKNQIFLLFTLLLFLCGCSMSAQGDSASAGPPNSAYSAAQISPGGLNEQETAILKTYERLSKENLSYDAYFSQERYWETDGWGQALFVYHDEEAAFYKKELDGTLSLLYAHDMPIDRAYWDNRYLFYFLSDHCIYRIFVPECQVEKVYENPRMSGFFPLSNYAILFTVQNPENEGKDEEHDWIEPPDYFIYHTKKDEEWPLIPEEIGLDSIGGSAIRSAREIYEIPSP